MPGAAFGANSVPGADGVPGGGDAPGAVSGAPGSCSRRTSMSPPPLPLAVFVVVVEVGVRAVVAVVVVVGLAAAYVQILVIPHGDGARTGAAAAGQVSQNTHRLWETAGGGGAEGY